MEALSFDFKSTYSLPDFDPDYGLENMFDMPLLTKPIVTMPIYQAPVVVPKVVQTIAPIVAPVVAKKTIAFTVYDGAETLPGANIAIDGIPTAQTNENGYVILPNVPATATVKITYVGYEDYIVAATAVPTKVVMKSSGEQLPELTIIGKKKPESNTWAWLLLGAVVVGGIFKYSRSGTKIVRAKI